MKYYEALKECIENGKRITRSDWNGKNQYVYYSKGKKIDVSAWMGMDDLTDSERLRGYVCLKSHLDMMNAQGERIIGWAATQTDVTSDKWEVLN